MFDAVKYAGIEEMPCDETRCHRDHENKKNCEIIPLADSIDFADPFIQQPFFLSLHDAEVGAYFVH